MRFFNLEVEQTRIGYSDVQMAEYLGLSRVVYVAKKKSGQFDRVQACRLLELFGCSFEYLFEASNEGGPIKSRVAGESKPVLPDDERCGDTLPGGEESA